MRVGERVSNTANGPSERRVRNGAKAGHGAREAADSRRSESERLGQAVCNHVLGRAVDKTGFECSQVLCMRCAGVGVRWGGRLLRPNQWVVRSACPPSGGRCPN